MSKKENLGVKDVLSKLHEYLEKEKVSDKTKKNITEAIPEIKKALNRSSELTENDEILVELTIAAETMNKTSKLSAGKSKSEGDLLMVKILTIILAKLETDGFIKINL